MIFTFLSDSEDIFTLYSSEVLNFNITTETILSEINGITFPHFIEITNPLSFTLTCKKTSQLSFFFQNTYEINSRGNNYETLTLLFEDNYCKVFLDFYKNDVYQKDMRKNMSLFNMVLDKENLFKFDFDNNVLDINNKQYPVPKNVKDFKYLGIYENYAPNGPGKYLIK